ncbi:hypothetical protein [Paraburkholderia phosphatilytica]|uniref:hypothetical protein n=1 Tax=Paraburkholderia phosphatilytica TaxID=2282883 RepID=UPI000E50097D|nr:hypothetical protein [Paraburkholderia phosphatilytica]
MGKPKTLDESLRVGHQTCDAALDAFNRLVSLLQAIDRLADESHNVDTISGLATIGLEIAQNMSNRVDNALVRMAANEAELRPAA